MKNKISLLAMRKAAESDAFQLSGLNLMICFVVAVIPALSLLAYDFFYGSIPLDWMVIAIIGFIISATFQGKALLDIVHNRKQNPFEYPFSLVQAFLVQAAALGLWYGLFSNFGGILHASFRILKGPVLLVFGFLFILMRLQFTSLYILEQQCSIVQAMHHSWLLTKHNNWLFERFVLWQLAAVIISILIFSSDWNINFLIMAVAMIVLLVTPMQVRMFKELK